MGTWQQVRAAKTMIASAGNSIIRGIWARFEQLTGRRQRHLAALRKLLAQAQVLHQQDRLTEAEAAYRQVLSLAPAHPDALQLLGVLQLERQNYPDAVDLISRALLIRPADATAWYHLGIGLFNLTQYQEAVASYDEAVRLLPDEAKFWKDRGGALRRLNRLTDALDSYDRALQLKPDYLAAHIGRGTALHDLNRVADAIESYDRALAIKPGEAAAIFDRALCRLLSGDFAGGWPGFETRYLDVRDLRERSLGLGMRWHGTEPLAGKSILLWAEPGLGETINFCRFARLVAAKGATVLLMLLDTREADILAPLMQRLEGPSRVLGVNEQAPQTDYNCPLHSLPLALNITLDNLPVERQYLSADRERIAAWNARLGPRRLPRIGLVWSGNPRHRHDYKRSIPLQEFVDLAEGPFEFVCLHKEVRETDRPLLEQRPDIRRFCDELNDMGDTAALLQLMDLVITVDTSVAHLAGALGRPVWILLSFSADWRYLLDRDDCPWYPTARLFRQPAIGDWQSLFAVVGRELAATAFPAVAPETIHAGPPC